MPTIFAPIPRGSNTPRIGREGATDKVLIRVVYQSTAYHVELPSILLLEFMSCFLLNSIKSTVLIILFKIYDEIEQFIKYYFVQLLALL